MNSDSARSKAALRYCPYCGADELDYPNPKLVQCRRCENQLYLNVAAAVVALIENQGQLLVTTRKHEPMAGTWDLPGGFVDPGETVEEALGREIYEELHLEMTAAEYFCSFPNRYLYGGVEYRTLDFAFLCRVKDLETLRAGDDVVACHWVEPRRLNPRRFGLKSIQRLVIRYQDHFIR